MRWSCAGCFRRFRIRHRRRFDSPMHHCSINPRLPTWHRWPNWQAFTSQLSANAALHEMLYSSLMAENHHRVAHLEGAVRHLDSEATKLAHRCNTLRQEEIIEEIEVILLSALDISERPENRNRFTNRN